MDAEQWINFAQLQLGEAMAELAPDGEMEALPIPSAVEEENVQVSAGVELATQADASSPHPTGCPPDSTDESRLQRSASAALRGSMTSPLGILVWIAELIVLGLLSWELARTYLGNLEAWEDDWICRLLLKGLEAYTAFFTYLNVVQLLLVCGVNFATLMRVYIVLGCCGMVVQLGVGCVLLVTQGHPGCASNAYPVLLGVLVFHMVDSYCVAPLMLSEEEKKIIEEAMVPPELSNGGSDYEALPTSSRPN